MLCDCMQKEVMHVGGDRFIPVNVRVICTSHKRLLDLVKVGSFRLDLYFRLAGVCLEVAPLRDRLEDVPLLIANVLKRYGKKAPPLSPRPFWMPSGAIPGRGTSANSCRSWKATLSCSGTTVPASPVLRRYSAIATSSSTRPRRGGRWGNSLPRTVWRLSARRCGAVRERPQKSGQGFGNQLQQPEAGSRSGRREGRIRSGLKLEGYREDALRAPRTPASQLHRVVYGSQTTMKIQEAVPSQERPLPFLESGGPCRLVPPKARAPTRPSGRRASTGRR